MVDMKLLLGLIMRAARSSKSGTFQSVFVKTVSLLKVMTTHQIVLLIVLADTVLLLIQSLTWTFSLMEEFVLLLMSLRSPLSTK